MQNEREYAPGARPTIDDQAARDAEINSIETEIRAEDGRQFTVHCEGEHYIDGETATAYTVRGKAGYVSGFFYHPALAQALADDLNLSDCGWKSCEAHARHHRRPSMGVLEAEREIAEQQEPEPFDDMTGPMDARPPLRESDVLPPDQRGGFSLMGLSDPQWLYDTMKFARMYAARTWPGQDVALEFVAGGMAVSFTPMGGTVNIASSKVRAWAIEQDGKEARRGNA